MFKTDKKYYCKYPKKEIFKKDRALASDLLITIFKNLANLNSFHIIKKKRFIERRLLTFVYMSLALNNFPNFKLMGYYNSRRDYTIAMVNLWKYTKFFHLLEKEDYDLFVNLLECLIDYWILCDDIKTYNHYLTCTNLVYDYKIQLIFKNYPIFSKKNIKKFLYLNNEDLYHVNKSIFLD